MLRDGTVNTPSRPSSLLPLRRKRRSIEIRVVDRGQEVDSFAVSTAPTLRAALRPIYAHLSAGDLSIQFRGVVEEWLPLGFGHARREADLKGLEDALHFLAA